MNSRQPMRVNVTPATTSAAPAIFDGPSGSRSQTAATSSAKTGIVLEYTDVLALPMRCTATYQIMYATKSANTA